MAVEVGRRPEALIHVISPGVFPPAFLAYYIKMLGFMIHDYRYQLKLESAAPHQLCDRWGAWTTSVVSQVTTTPLYVRPSYFLQLDFMHRP